MEKIVTLIMTVFMVLGAFDRALFKNRFGLGEEFAKGINCTGPLILGMAGIMCISPVLGKGILALATPLFHVLGADPAMIFGTCFALDMGGYAMTVSMTADPDTLLLGGILLSSTLGATIVFLIPVSLSLCQKEDISYVSKGLVFGIISIPFATIAGALAGGLSIQKTLVSAAPAFVLSVFLALGMCCFPAITLKLFQGFNFLLQALILLSLAAAAVETSLGIVIIPGMDPLGEQLKTIGLIGITLAGAYPLVHVLSVLLSPMLGKIGDLLGMDIPSVTGMLACLANPLPLIDLLPRMSPKSKTMAIAFSVCANACIGDHFAFLSATCPKGTAAMFAAKLTGGLFGLLIAGIVLKRGNKSGNA